MGEERNFGRKAFYYSYFSNFTWYKMSSNTPLYNKVPFKPMAKIMSIYFESNDYNSSIRDIY